MFFRTVVFVQTGPHRPRWVSMYCGVATSGSMTVRIGLHAQEGLGRFKQHGWAGWPALDTPQVLADKEHSIPG